MTRILWGLYAVVLTLLPRFAEPHLHGWDLVWAYWPTYLQAVVIDVLLLLTEDD